MRGEPARWRTRLVAGQGGYYLATGLWPVIHLGSFEAVTGPKTDDWLVHMVGLLAAVIGVSLIVAVLRAYTHSATVTTLAAGSALAFAAIDLWYGLTGRISPIFLADAVVELGIVVLLALTRKDGATRSEP
jgi:energy-converting hydrogenase Eha subunit E